MKFFITGLHSSGKQEVVNILKNMGISCGKLFTNFDVHTAKNSYNKDNYEVYTNDEVTEIFENNAYVFFQEFPNLEMNFSVGNFCEGLSKYEFDENQVFILSPDQVLSITPNSINEEICFVWLDNNKDNRSSRYRSEKRNYNYNNREHYEKTNINAYVKVLYSFNNSSLLYFTNEEPCRVATIIYTLIKHPELFNTYIENFD